jgi:hypothetical protein
LLLGLTIGGGGDIDDAFSTEKRDFRFFIVGSINSIDEELISTTPDSSAANEIFFPLSASGAAAPHLFLFFVGSSIINFQKLH